MPITITVNITPQVIFGEYNVPEEKGGENKNLAKELDSIRSINVLRKTTRKRIRV